MEYVYVVYTHVHTILTTQCLGERDRVCDTERQIGQPPEPRQIWRRFLSIGECCTPTYTTEDKESGEAVRARVLTRLRLTPTRIPVSLDSIVCLFFQLDGSILCTLKLFSMLQASG
ncbi:hypothetical protein HanRHA438_Chr07g0298991 [Helianthus annuus]|uniref:Uncharacterized protein n=1 Tax=Helianthus annuus TaxID=4232 RepID=A0A9K3NF57_HELAN|nr:hypothetical protein HanXRQr2_Chr07g0288461 [Helianthus annuus]KAJ0549721.1 hypothetical protein HanHA300_Chr07g0237121 [Helianthus annuus]KAJ0556218.1 hypothetical protein HanIR_Chr07g0311221 [Helianthus annuus]KAJ0562676.1 hypothetical protein HanHA89_Chr07g0254301 [Helianthus annuus]KAJ0728052.1 hypothetical protein HanLR1_Chr07g0237071 [Helianthus annuus]